MEKIPVFVNLISFFGIIDLLHFSAWFSEYPLDFIFAIKEHYNFINKYELAKTACNWVHLPETLRCDFLYFLHRILTTNYFMNSLKKSMLLQFNACLFNAGELEIQLWIWKWHSTLRDWFAIYLLHKNFYLF